MPADRRVLVLTPDFPPLPGGIQVLAHRLVTHFRRLETEVVTLDAPGAAAFDRGESLRVRRVGRRLPTRRGAVLALNGRGVAQGLSSRPDAVLSVHIVTAPAAWLVARSLRVPFVLYLHADELRARPGLTRWACGRADRILAVSRYTANLAVRAGAEAERVRTVPNGVDLPRGVQAPRARRPTLVTVATLNYRYKGHDVVMRALPLVRARVPDVEWTIVGDGLLRPYLEQLAVAHGVQDVVRFVGATSDAERDARLDRAHVFAMPSRVPAGGVGGEGFGIVYLEANAHGLPVVAGNVAGAPDAVADGRTGLLVDPHDHLAVADAISELLTDPVRASALGERGRERARDFAWPRVAARVEDVMLEVLDGGGGGHGAA